MVEDNKAFYRVASELGKHNDKPIPEPVTTTLAACPGPGPTPGPTTSSKMSSGENPTQCPR